jgi:hypothetical protein
LLVVVAGSWRAAAAYVDMETACRGKINQMIKKT